jgi:hypothetical protein
MNNAGGPGDILAITSTSRSLMDPSIPPGVGLPSNKPGPDIGTTLRNVWKGSQRTLHAVLGKLVLLTRYQGRCKTD